MPPSYSRDDYATSRLDRHGVREGEVETGMLLDEMIYVRRKGKNSTNTLRATRTSNELTECQNHYVAPLFFVFLFFCFFSP